jgi:hypothetical protein
VQQILRVTMSSCMLGDFVGPLLDPQLLAAASSAAAVRSELSDAEPSWSALPEDLVHRAVLGGLGSALLDLAYEDREKRVRGHRTRLDPDAIRQRAAHGIARGRDLLRQSVADAASALDKLRSTMGEGAAARLTDLSIPIDIRRLRVVVDRLQFPDPGDPALIGRRVLLTIRIRLNESVVAHHVLDVDVPRFDHRGGIIDLKRDIGEVDVHAGERFSIEVLAGHWQSQEVDPGVVRFTDTRSGNASEWIGPRVPARSQTWRLWYHIT